MAVRRCYDLDYKYIGARATLCTLGINSTKPSFFVFPLADSRAFRCPRCPRPLHGRPVTPVRHSVRPFRDTQYVHDTVEKYNIASKLFCITLMERLITLL